MFSAGLLYSTHDFLNLIFKTSFTSEEFKNYFKNYKYSTADKILEVSFKCGWSKLTQGGQIELSIRGKEIASLDYKAALLLQIEDLILNFNPVWASVIPKGRTEAKNFLPLDALQCFKECGLFDELNDEIVRFWDKLALAYRNYTNIKLTEIGRTGEKFSYEYEFKRTGKPPIWQAVESNLAGFDLLSVVDDKSFSKLQIEVKATTSSITYAKIHITKNEWETAVNSLNYIFHLWQISSKSQIHIITIDKIEKHIPVNSGTGEWEIVEIPFVSLIN